MTDGGLFIPHNELMETDGGKVTTRPSKQKYYNKGKIIQITKVAEEKLNAAIDHPLDNWIGVGVFLAKQATTSDTFHFYIDRTKQVQDFKGVLAIPHTLIEAIDHDDNTTQGR